VKPGVAGAAPRTRAEEGGLPAPMRSAPGVPRGAAGLSTAFLAPAGPGRFPTPLADRCVMCGMCLGVCPTYGEARDEAESPRGRIALMRALAEGRLAPTEQALGHLDRCLACRACEAICPSEVPYGELIDAARSLLEPGRRRPLGARLVRRLGGALAAADPRVLMRIGRWLRWYQRSGLAGFARRTHLLRALGIEAAEALLPPLGAPFQRSGYYPAVGPERGRVGLFVGCVARLADAATAEAALRVLRRVGYGVYVPKGQGCCGALHRHAGEAGAACQLAQRNLEAFADLPLKAVIGTASGCTAALAEYPLWMPEARAWPAPVSDVCAFLAERWPGALALAPLARRIGIHTPCTLKYALHDKGGVRALLAHVPEIDLQPLSERPACCGAAGDYMLREPAMAAALRDAVLTSFDGDILVTSNIGCALHLRAGTEVRETPMEVMHPVVLVARQLEASPAK
jgi:glycolate oxidase iron-sulfur subunit